MTSDKKIEAEGANEAGSPPGATTAPPSGASADATPPPADEAAAAPVEEEMARLKAEAADLKDRLLRAHAEMDNVRKRLEREKADASRFAITKFARDIVGVGDNVQRAIDAVPQASAEQDPALKSFLDGVTMIERELLAVLERYGVRRLDPKGEVFNPHQHQAVMEMPAPDVPSGTVTQVFQPGYMIEDRVLRPAMVAVARGGMKPPSPPAEATDAPSAADPASSEPPGAADGGDGNGDQQPG